MKDFNLLPEMMISLEKMKISIPTEIQKQTIPMAMQGRDILASSQTGSGKTLAYLIPLILSILESKGKALVLVPTRELATQVRDALVQISGSLRISSAIIIGGEPMPKQYSRLSANPKVIIGTPGRLIDHLNRKSLKLNEAGVVVLDEMDRMLDMGMKEQLEEIVKYLPEQKQVLMFSATMPKHIIALSQKYLNNPHHVTIGSASKPASTITQEFVRLSVKEKLPRLIKMLSEQEGSTIIFTKTKRGADELAKNLKAEGYKCDAIHGDLRQSRRDKVLLAFRKSLIRILVATDVAARGLDIPHTEHVINWELPMSPEDYLHRIGRTGRAGNLGNAVSFVSPDENSKLRAIEKLINHGETTSREELMGPKNSKSSRNFGQNSGGARNGRNYANPRPRRDENRRGSDRKDLSGNDRFGRNQKSSGQNPAAFGNFRAEGRKENIFRENRARDEGRREDRFKESKPRDEGQRANGYKEAGLKRNERKNENKEGFFRNNQDDRNFRSQDSRNSQVQNERSFRDRDDKNPRSDKSKKIGDNYSRWRA